MNTNKAQDTTLPWQTESTSTAGGCGCVLRPGGLLTMSVPNSPLGGKTQSCRLLGTEPRTDPATLGQRDHPMQGEILSLESKPCPVRSVQHQNSLLAKVHEKNTKLHPIPYCKPPSSFTSNWPLLPLRNTWKHWIESLFTMLDPHLLEGSVTIDPWVHSWMFV